FVTLGAEHVETAGGKHDFLLGRDFTADALHLLVSLGSFSNPGEFVLNAELDIAAELDVGSPTSHVGSDRHGAGTPGLRNDVSLLLMKPGIEDRVLDSGLLEEFGQHLGLF